MTKHCTLTLCVHTSTHSSRPQPKELTQDEEKKRGEDTHSTVSQPRNACMIKHKRQWPTHGHDITFPYAALGVIIGLQKSRLSLTVSLHFHTKSNTIHSLMHKDACGLHIHNIHALHSAWIAASNLPYKFHSYILHIANLNLSATHSCDLDKTLSRTLQAPWSEARTKGIFASSHSIWAKVSEQSPF